MNASFTTQLELSKAAESYATECVDFMTSQFQVTLDYSTESIVAIEHCVGVLHDQLAEHPLTEEQLDYLSKIFGSYLGETYRKNYGAAWGLMDDRQPALKTTTDVICFPWVRVYKRITQGPGENLVAWFGSLTENNGSGTSTASSTVSKPPALPRESSTRSRPTLAERPSRIKVDKKMADQFERQFTGCLGLPATLILRLVAKKTEMSMLCEHALMGDCNPAIVISLNPLVVAAYADEMDAVVLLRFKSSLVAAFDLTLGKRLVSANSYMEQVGRAFARDVEVGENHTGRYVNFKPVILDFITKDKERLELLRKMIPEAMWHRAEELGIRKFQGKACSLRFGSPFRSIEKYEAARKA
jgi:hypothetical protein